jgi:hypothetical protein
MPHAPVGAKKRIKKNFMPEKVIPNYKKYKKNLQRNHLQETVQFKSLLWFMHI